MAYFTLFYVNLLNLLSFGKYFLKRLKNFVIEWWIIPNDVTFSVLLFAYLLDFPCPFNLAITLSLL